MIPTKADIIKAAEEKTGFNKKKSVGQLNPAYYKELKTGADVLV